MARPIAVLSLAAALVTVVACSAGTTGSTQPPTQQPVSSPSTSTSSSGADACEEFLSARDRTAMKYGKVKLSIGTDIDETATLADVVDFTVTMADDAAECAPQAADALSRLRDQTRQFADAYVTNADPATAKKLFAMLVAVRPTAEAAWQAMDLGAQGWAWLPTKDDGSTI